ncbi:MAG: hypothetical protein JEY97_07120 [Bacteroidales bacterium]|nr:hypothetical protein [Bacteroidales bacterium]
MKKHKKILLFVLVSLIPILIAYQFFMINFKHYHYLPSGEIICHSHPYANSNSNSNSNTSTPFSSNHTHTKNQIVFLDLFSASFFLSLVFILTSKIFLLNTKRIESKKKTIYFSNNYFYSLKNKAPPILFV